MSVDTVWCVVPTAGQVVPLGSDCPPTRLPLGGSTVLEQTLGRLAAHPRVAGLMMALDRNDAHGLAVDQLHGKPVLTADGGFSRCDAVLAGLRALPEAVGERDFVLVHDPLRPCVRGADIERLIVQAAPAGGGLLGVPVREMLKRANDQRCSEATEQVDRRWRALSPQMFRRGELTRVMQAVANRGWTVSDEAMAMEIAGFRPLLVEGAPDNLRVVTPDDLAYAGFLLAGDA